MTEQKGVYTVPITNYMNTDEHAVCKCGRVIGRFVTVEDRDLLVINDGLVSHHDEICMVCRTPYHWRLSDGLMQKILDRHKARLMLDSST
jgi:hypothetical protein